jgi:flagellar basal body-associated protein FliL
MSALVIIMSALVIIMSALAGIMSALIGKTSALEDMKKNVTEWNTLNAPAAGLMVV